MRCDIASFTIIKLFEHFFIDHFNCSRISLKDFLFFSFEKTDWRNSNGSRAETDVIPT